MAASVDQFFRNFNLQQKIEPPVRSHLKTVYAYLTMSVLSAAAGAYLHMFHSFFWNMGTLAAFGSMGVLLALHFTPDDGKNRPKRTAMLMGFAFLSGMGLGPLLNFAVAVNPTLIPTAFMSTCLIFACFTLAALYAPNGHYLYLGGTLLSGLSMLMWLGLLNIFFRSPALFQIHLWGGLLIFCGFVVYDTQAIMEKRRRGDKDAIRHSLDLFIDFLHLFRKILILLLQKENRNDNKNKNRR
jgi:FtsH-binding integral membrane protein